MTNASPGASDNCPSEAQLRSFCSGDLPDGELARLAAHVAACQHCESRLSTLAGPDTQLRGARRAGRQVSPDVSQAVETTGEAVKTQPQALPLGPSPASPAEPIPPGPQETPAVSPTDAVPEKIGPYFVIRRLGGGGFADVYLAKDPETNKKVAIKVPRRDKVRTERSAERFLKEARTAAELDHPAIVQVSDYGRLDDGTCYVVMEYLEGRSLQELLKAERLSPRQAAEIVRQLAEGLCYAHRRGVYHRDIKPGNILIGEHGRAKIVDFGLAINEEERWSYKDEQSGTLPYMSPEQVRGEAHLIDGRTDLWSLGVVFYQMLARQRPFAGRTADQLRDEILHKPPKPVRMVEEGVPKELDEICLRCLAQAVGERMPTAAELAAELQAFLQPAPPPARRWPRRRVLLMLAVALGAGGILLGLALLRPGRTAVTRWQQVFPELGEIRWPGSRGPADIRDGPELAVMHDGVALVRLGELNGKHYRISFQMRQPDWPGRVGMFWGYRLEDQWHHESATFQLVWIERVRLPEDGKPMWEWKEVFQLRRTRQFISPPDASSRQQADLGAVLIPWPRGKAKLELELDGSQLKAVLWDGKPILELCSKERNGQTSRTDYVGPWGLFQESGSSAFSDPLFETLR